MGVFDKLKNALFEVEYVEVDEKPKKEKKNKHILKKEKEKEKVEEKPIAKKIVLPKKEDRIEELEEEDLKDEDFEIRPKDETIKEEKRSFKFMDDEDFAVMDEPRIVETFDLAEEDNNTNDSRMQNNQEKIVNDKVEDIPKNTSYEYNDSYANTRTVRESKPYGVDDSYKLNVHEYGTYEKKEEKAYFKPSPIISPIYGVLDKNYKKEDVVSKKDIRITSNYSRTNVDVDDIRNKAFGRRGARRDNSVEDQNTFEVDDTEENLLVDLSDEKDKPEVKQVTVGDAMEYFQDLGLEYNVDYVDASKDKEQQNKVNEEKNNDPEPEKKKVEKTKKEDSDKKQVVEEKHIENKAVDSKNQKSVVEVKDESKKGSTKEVDDDNLFDLIDSMYSEDN